jgi:hypothetical protein
MAKEQLKSLTQKRKDKKEKRIEIREIENGFIIRKTIEYQDPKKGWQCETKEFFSKTDPFEITNKSLTEIFD